MGYVGNQTTTSFTSMDKQTITGTGASTYTLSHNVSSEFEIEVFVNNVRQEGGSGKAYTVSNNQITFSENINSTDDCYVIFQGKAIQTVVPPDGSVTSAKLATAFPSASLDMNGTELVLDSDGDTSITSDTDDRVDIKVGGSDVFHVTSNGIAVGQETSTGGNTLVDIHGSGSGRGANIAFANDHNTDKFFVGIAGDTTGNVLIYNAENSNMIFGTNNIERMSIDNAGRFRVPSVHSSTTGSGANVRVQTDGKLERSTSSQRYKNTINDATHGLTELLNLKSVTYKGNNDGDTIFGGLIAEEVHDAGLTEFVEYDDQNRPDALHYGNMVSLCIKAIQELKTELDNAKARITALEGN